MLPIEFTKITEIVYDELKFRFDKEKYLITVIRGESLNDEKGNLESFVSSVRPIKGETIITKKFGKNVVKDVVIDYSQIQYTNPDDNGSEIIFVFI